MTICKHCKETFNKQEASWFGKKICKKCVENRLVSIENILFIDTCKYCNGDFYEQETGWFEKGICRDCLESKLIIIECNANKFRLCDNKQCKDCYYRSFVSSNRAKYWSSKNKVTPRDKTKGNSEKMIFDCYCGHEFEISLGNITRKNQWCGYCCTNSKKFCDNKNCKSCYEKSFASTNRGKNWSKENPISARYVTKSSRQYFLFDCDECNHTFEMRVDAITNSGQWCNYCANLKLCDKDIDCTFCFNKTVASSIRGKNWSKKNHLTAREVVLRCEENFLFDCECGHEILMRPSNILAGRWCSYCCTYTQKLCENNDCKMCFENSLDSSDKGKFLHKTKNDKTARQITRGCNKLYWFICENNHEFQNSPNAVIGKGRWCSLCINKTEAKLLLHLKELYDVITQMKIEHCKVINQLSFDFCIKLKKIIIELDGRQHFEYVERFKNDYVANIKRDVYKMKCALEDGYTVIRIIQEDVWNDSYDWKKVLSDIISQAPYDTPRVFYHDEKDRYINHQNYMDGIDDLKRLNIQDDCE